jgi:hypothetical protein
VPVNLAGHAPPQGSLLVSTEAGTALCWTSVPPPQHALAMAMLVYEGNQIELSGECVLGRQRACGVVLKDGAASRQHARVFQADNVWWVEDLGSANGSKLNGIRFEGRRGLRNGDAIRIGDAEVLFHCSERESGPEAKPQAQRPDPQSLEGRTIGGYLIGQMLGRSAMGFLYRAQQTSLQRTVAFKVFSRKVCEEDGLFAERFLALASKSGSLQHDGFVQIHENGVEDGLVWYSMEFVEGDTLAHLLEREGRFVPELALLVCEKVARAMAEAHRAGITHSDLNPRTLMLTKQGKVKILDLGIAAMLGRGRDRNRPEQAWHVAHDARTGEAQPADDSYALGCLLHHLLAGQPPFTGATAEEVRRAHASNGIPSLRKVVPGLPAAADELFQGLLTKNRDWRLVDLSDVATRLRALREGLAGGNAAQDPAERLVGRAVASQKKREGHLLRRVLLFGGLCLAVLITIMVAPEILARYRASLQVSSLVPAPPPLVRFKPDPPRPQVPVVPVVPAAALVTSDPLLALVQDFRRRSAGGAAIGWSTLDREATTLAGRIGEGSAAATELRLVRQQLAEDAEGWYKAELAKLPPSGQITVGARLTALSRLRDEVGTAERLDADVRYQEELANLVQRLNDARRQARLTLEAGRPGELPAIAAGLAPAFAGTPFIALQRQFALRCGEAAGLAAFWNTDWRTTAIGFERQRGESALAAAAALLLTSDPGRAKRVLLADPQLATGLLMRRREALMGGLAAVLTFDEPADMQYLDITAGEPVLGGGALCGVAGQAVSLGSTVLVGGADWMAEIVLTLASPQAEIVLSCVAGGEPSLLMRLADGKLLARHGGAERTQAVSLVGQRRLRLTSRGGLLVMVLDGRELARFEHAAVPPEAQLRLDLAGSDWRLEEMQVVGGR